jgi:hypothetical protein
MPLLDSLWRNLKNSKNKEDISYTYSFLFGGTLKMARTKKTCPIPLLDSLYRNLKKCQKKEYMTYISLKFYFEEP